MNFSRPIHHASRDAGSVSLLLDYDAHRNCGSHFCGRDCHSDLNLRNSDLSITDAPRTGGFNLWVHRPIRLGDDIHDGLRSDDHHVRPTRRDGRRRDATDRDTVVLRYSIHHDHPDCFAVAISDVDHCLPIHHDALTAVIADSIDCCSELELLDVALQ